MKAWDLDKFKGVFVAMYSAYDEAGEVCEERVKKLARYYVNSGVKGLYVGGSSGEGILQTAEERKKVVEAVTEEVGRELTIIVHIWCELYKRKHRTCDSCGKMWCTCNFSRSSNLLPIIRKSVERHWQEMIDSIFIAIYYL